MLKIAIIDDGVDFSRGKTAYHSIYHLIVSPDGVVSKDESEDSFYKNSHGTTCFDIIHACIKYALKMTISELNKNDVVEYLSYLEVNKIEGSVAFCSPFGNSSINSKILELKLQDRFNLYKSIRQFYQERGIAKKAPTSVLSCKLMSDDSLSTCVITGSGELYLCDRWKDSLLGNIHDASLKELLNPEKIEDLKKTIQKRAELIKQTHCNDCILVGVCSQGCPALSEARDGSIFSLDGECSFRKQLFLYDRMLKGYI